MICDLCRNTHLVNCVVDTILVPEYLEPIYSANLVDFTGVYRLAFGKQIAPEMIMCVIFTL